MNILKEIESAEQRIRSHTLTTPLMESKELSSLTGAKVFLKLESEQHTGSFKARGSLNKMLSLTAAEKESGIVTASTGNHALGCARALELTETKGIIFLPKNASPAKVAALEHYKAELQFFGTNSLETELHAKQYAHQNNKVWVSPYDDLQIIAGQGTIGVELIRQLDHFDATFITIGGGGLISGIGTYLKAHRPATKIIGCLPENSPEMKLSLDKGAVVTLEEFKETLSDGSAGGVEEDAITFPICQQVVEECVLVSEEEIAAAIKFMVYKHRKIIEGAAGVTIASLIKNKDKFKGKTVALVICGCNIDAEKLKKIL